MSGACVVCGEVVEGKPLYKKLGDGEHNVEVMTALRALQLITLPESAKSSSYICWDCDEVVVREYGRHLEMAAKEKAARQARKQRQKPSQKKKSKAYDMKMKMKVAEAARQESFWVVQQVNPPPPRRERRPKVCRQSVSSGHGISKPNKAHHSSHCLMCDSGFESESRGFLRHSLKKAVNDEMDVAQVMEVLGLARHIEPSMKARRFICNPCYVIIRRNYKNKLLKGTSIESPPTTALPPNQDPIHRATTEEHAAEIAKLLPPALAECYKILTTNPLIPPAVAPVIDHNDNASITNVDLNTVAPQTLVLPSTPLGDDQTYNQAYSTPPEDETVPHWTLIKKNSTVTSPRKSGGTHKITPILLTNKSASSINKSPRTGTAEDTDAEEEDGGLNLSQDEHGNYFIDVMSTHNSGNEKRGAVFEGTPHVPRKKKKNVLLPKRLHHHLSGNGYDSPAVSSSDRADSNMHGEEEARASPILAGITINQEACDSHICNICGISFSGKASDWWHTLTSHLSGFDSITVNMALKVLETQLAHTTEAVRAAQQVCLPCFTMVSAGFRSQVVQRFARQKNLNTSQIDLSRVKVRLLSKETVASSDFEKQNLAAGRGVADDENSEVDAGDFGNDSCDEIPVDGMDMDFEKVNNLMNSSFHRGQKRKRIDGEEFQVNKKIVSGEMHSNLTPRPIVRKEVKRRRYKTKARNRKHGRKKRKPSMGVVTTCLIPGRRPRGRPPKPRVDVPAVPNFSNAVGGVPVKRRRGRPKKICSGNEGSLVVIPENRVQEDAQVGEDASGKPVVVLKDLKFVLPREAFGGKTVSALTIEENISEPGATEQTQPSSILTDSMNNTLLDSTPMGSGTNLSPLQVVFNALSTYHPSESETKDNTQSQAVDGKDNNSDVRVCGRCIVCGFNYMLRPSMWHTLSDNIKPPTLMVPVEWVCVSLSVMQLHLPEPECKEGKVCGQCYSSLGEKFQRFVKSKVGESCGLAAEEVDLSEYLITFNPQTLNLEADPKQQSYIHEFEDGGELLLRILPLMQQFSVDQLVSRGARQPLQSHHYSVWLLLLLNELRIQVGAALGELKHWLVSLMPSEMYNSGLRPCSVALAAFLLQITRASTAVSEEELNNPIPSSLFVVAPSEVVGDPTSSPPPSTPTTSTDLVVTSSRNVMQTSSGSFVSDGGEVLEMKDLPWEGYLQHINMDSLMVGTAKPIPVHLLTQGLVYAIWQVSRLLAGGDQLIVDWVKQLSPVPLGERQIQKLITIVGSLQSHLESYPEDIHQLNCEVLPLLNRDDCTPHNKMSAFQSASEVQDECTVPQSDGVSSLVKASSKMERTQTVRSDDDWTPGRKGRKRKFWYGRKGRLPEKLKPRNSPDLNSDEKEILTERLSEKQKCSHSAENSSEEREITEQKHNHSVEQNIEERGTLKERLSGKLKDDSTQDNNRGDGEPLTERLNEDNNPSSSAEHNREDKESLSSSPGSDIILPTTLILTSDGITTTTCILSRDSNTVTEVRALCSPVTSPAKLISPVSTPSVMSDTSVTFNTTTSAVTTDTSAVTSDTTTTSTVISGITSTLTSDTTSTVTSDDTTSTSAIISDTTPTSTEIPYTTSTEIPYTTSTEIPYTTSTVISSTTTSTPASGRLSTTPTASSPLVRATTTTSLTSATANVPLFSTTTTTSPQTSAATTTLTSVSSTSAPLTSANTTSPSTSYSSTLTSTCSLLGSGSDEPRATTTAVPLTLATTSSHTSTTPTTPLVSATTTSSVSSTTSSASTSTEVSSAVTTPTATSASHSCSPVTTALTETRVFTSTAILTTAGTLSAFSTLLTPTTTTASATSIHSNNSTCPTPAIKEDSLPSSKFTLQETEPDNSTVQETVPDNSSAINTSREMHTTPKLASETQVEVMEADDSQVGTDSMPDIASEPQKKAMATENTQEETESTHELASDSQGEVTEAGNTPAEIESASDLALKSREKVVDTEYSQAMEGSQVIDSPCEDTTANTTHTEDGFCSDTEAVPQTGGKSQTYTEEECSVTNTVAENEKQPEETCRSVSPVPLEEKRNETLAEENSSETDTVTENVPPVEKKHETSTKESCDINTISESEDEIEKANRNITLESHVEKRIEIPTKDDSVVPDMVTGNEHQTEKTDKSMSLEPLVEKRIETPAEEDKPATNTVTENEDQNEMIESKSSVPHVKSNIVDKAKGNIHLPDGESDSDQYGSDSDQNKNGNQECLVKTFAMTCNTDQKSNITENEIDRDLDKSEEGDFEENEVVRDIVNKLERDIKENESERDLEAERDLKEKKSEGDCKEKEEVGIFEENERVGDCEEREKMKELEEMEEEKDLKEREEERDHKEYELERNIEDTKGKRETGAEKDQEEDETENDHEENETEKGLEENETENDHEENETEKGLEENKKEEDLKENKAERDCEEKEEVRNYEENQPEKDFEENSKDDSDYERESEAVQVSNKLFSKVRELESELETMKRHNQQLKEDNIKLSGLYIPETMPDDQEEQANYTLNHVEGQLKVMISKVETRQGTNKVVILSPHPTLPSNCAALPSECPTLSTSSCPTLPLSSPAQPTSSTLSSSCPASHSDLPSSCPTLPSSCPSLPLSHQTISPSCLTLPLSHPSLPSSQTNLRCNNHQERKKLKAKKSDMNSEHRNEDSGKLLQDSHKNPECRKEGRDKCYQDTSNRSFGHHEKCQTSESITSVASPPYPKMLKLSLADRDLSPKMTVNRDLSPKKTVAKVTDKKHRTNTHSQPPLFNTRANDNDFKDFDGKRKRKTVGKNKGETSGKTKEETNGKSQGSRESVNLESKNHLEVRTGVPKLTLHEGKLSIINSGKKADTRVVKVFSKDTSAPHEKSVTSGNRTAEKRVIVSGNKTVAKSEVKLSSKADKHPHKKPLTSAGSVSCPFPSKVMLVPPPSHKNYRPLKIAKKPRLSFEELMNYDVKVRAPK